MLSKFHFFQKFISYILIRGPGSNYSSHGLIGQDDFNTQRVQPRLNKMEFGLLLNQEVLSAYDDEGGVPKYYVDDSNGTYLRFI